LIDMPGTEPVRWLDLTTGESPDRWLRDAWSRPDDAELEVRVERRKESGAVVLATCLDADANCARTMLAAAADHAETNAVLIPAGLEHEVPAEIPEVWIVDAPLERLGGWLRDLEERIERELDARPAAQLVAVRVPGATEPEPLEVPAHRRPVVGKAVDVARALAATLLRKRDKPEGPAEYPGPLPAVLRDSQGLLFEVSDRDDATALVNRGHFERDEIELASRYLRPGMTAIDVGANRGAFTASMARSVAPDGVVHAFEPGAAARAQLARTLELNGIGNVEVVAAAVADGVGEAALAHYGAGFESWSSLVRREIDLGETLMLPVTDETVPTLTLDDYCAERGIARIDVLKVDVEGAEPLVLAGGARLLGSHAIDVTLIEVSDSTLSAAGATSHDLLDVLERAGLRTYVLEDGRLVPFRVAGPTSGLVQVIAASAGGRAGLSAAGYSER
jgi:FkbM family methyltransferase